MHPADIQDRDGAVNVLLDALRVAPTLETIFADGGYAGPKLRRALAEHGIEDLLEIVTKPSDRDGFAVLPKRWVVERTFA